MFRQYEEGKLYEEGKHHIHDQAEQEISGEEMLIILTRRLIPAPLYSNQVSQTRIIVFKSRPGLSLLKLKLSLCFLGTVFLPWAQAHTRTSADSASGWTRFWARWAGRSSATLL